MLQLSLIKKIISYYYGVRLSANCQIGWRALGFLGEGVRVNNHVLISGDVRIGRFSSINGPGTIISARVNPVIIGNFCSIAPNVCILEYFHRFDRATTYYILRNIFGKALECDIFSKGPVIIEDDVWIGSNTTILSGVKIGRGSVVGAGSVVTKDVPRYSVVVGNPARWLRPRFKQPATIERLEELQWWNWEKNKLISNEELFFLREDQIKGYEEINF